MTELRDQDESGTWKKDINDAATYYQIRENTIQVNNRKRS